MLGPQSDAVKRNFASTLFGPRLRRIVLHHLGRSDQSKPELSRCNFRFVGKNGDEGKPALVSMNYLKRDKN